MKTRMTQLLGIRHPIMMGGMMGANCAESAAAVSNAGGIGTICAVLYPDLDEFRAELRKIKELTALPFAVNVTMAPEHRATDLTGEYFRIIVEEGVPVVETAGRNPAEYIPLLKQNGVKVLHKVVALRYALSAQRMGVDAVTVMGYESAGHPGMDEVTLPILTQRMAQSLTIPVIVSGGSVDGRGLVAALAWGAEGIEMGTRFLATEECPVHPAVKEQLLSYSEGDTVLVQRSIGNSLRVARNRHAEEVLAREAQGATLEDLLPLINGKLTRGYLRGGSVDRGLLALGQTVGLIDEIKSTRAVVEDTISQAEAILHRLSGLC